MDCIDRTHLFQPQATMFFSLLRKVLHTTSKPSMDEAWTHVDANDWNDSSISLDWVDVEDTEHSSKVITATRSIFAGIPQEFYIRSSVLKPRMPRTARQLKAMLPKTQCCLRLKKNAPLMTRLACMSNLLLIPKTLQRQFQVHLFKKHSL